MSATSIFMPAGARPCATRSAILLKDPLRRLPQIPRTLMSLIAYLPPLVRCSIDIAGGWDRRAMVLLAWAYRQPRGQDFIACARGARYLSSRVRSLAPSRRPSFV